MTLSSTNPSWLTFGRPSRDRSLTKTFQGLRRCCLVPATAHPLSDLTVPAAVAAIAATTAAATAAPPPPRLLFVKLRLPPPPPPPEEARGAPPPPPEKARAPTATAAARFEALAAAGRRDSRRAVAVRRKRRGCRRRSRGFSVRGFAVRGFRHAARDWALRSCAAVRRGRRAVRVSGAAKLRWARCSLRDARLSTRGPGSAPRSCARARGSLRNAR